MTKPPDAPVSPREAKTVKALNGLLRVVIAVRYSAGLKGTQLARLKEAQDALKQYNDKKIFGA